jgi:hypothetical protein
MFGAAGGDAIWTGDGDRLVALAPQLLHRGQSVALGARIQVPGQVSAVAGSLSDGLFVSTSRGLYYLAPDVLAAGRGVDATTPSVSATPWMIAADGHGGVNYADDDRGMHWVP